MSVTVADQPHGDYGLTTMTAHSTGTIPSADCALVVNVGPRDHAIAALTLQHLVRTHKRAFAEIVVVLDGQPASGRLAGAPGADDGSLQATLSTLPSTANVISVDRSPRSRAEVNERWFGRPDVNDRCAGGTPIFPFVFGLDAAEARYRLHMDCDMLVHDPKPTSWVQDGIELLKSEADVMFVNQMMGPNSDIVERPEFYAERDVARNLRLSRRFSTRCFLYDHHRLAATFPIRPVVHRWQRRYMYIAAGRGRYVALEHMVERHLHLTRNYRCDLEASHGFTVHAWDKSHFEESAIVDTIAAVEAGVAPREQYGRIDLTRPWIVAP